MKACWFQIPVKTGIVTRGSRAAAFVYSLIRTARLRTLALALASLAPLASLAIDGSATVTGGQVDFYGATETNWLNGTELLLKFEGEGSFVLPGLTKARILAVGGGGGGGGIRSAAAAMVVPYGAGGGGGAGGFVEVTNVFSAATYAIAVGAGGAGGASATTHYDPYYPGKSGGSTTITTNGEEFITAKGGGGGGGETDGLSGGSGGGGSQFRSGSGAAGASPRNGGAGTSGQGYAGGTGDTSLYGGGGGGAGGAGAAASTLNPVGGDGLPSDITGEALYYAGGGGGGFSDKSFTGVHEPIAGGKGGGGKGGYGLNVARTDATFYGGGGGGCGALPTSSTTPGGSGYQGVVYVRISIVAVGEIVKPTESQTVDFDGKEHVLVSGSPAYVIRDMATGQVTNRMAGTLSGTYTAKVTLVDGFKWSDGTDNEVTVTLTIKKATPVISNLAIGNWIVGTPAEATPNPGCDISINNVTPVYGYSATGTEPWSTEKPTEVGTYYLRAYIGPTESYNSAEATTTFRILDGPGDVFRDYVEIALDGAVLETNVYALKISEGNPVGFLYSRAGATGADLAITDYEGNLLDYKVYDWNVSGESTIWVTLPTTSTAGQTNRLFWCVRDGKTPPPHASAVDEPTGTQPGYDFDLVVRDGKRVNYWLTYPSLSKTKWDSLTETPATVTSYGTIKEGTASLLYVTNLNTGVVYDGTAGIISAPGSFSAVFGPHDPAGNYEPLDYPIDYFVVGHVTYGDLSGDFFGEEDGLTKNGRVLLANDDSAPGGYTVKGQSYWQTDGSKYSTYWVHLNEHSATWFPYLRSGVNHVLCSIVSGVTNELWKLDDVMIGSPYTSSLTPLENQCYLPNSPTAKAISSETASPGLAEQGNIVMRNKLGAAVLSSVYTNGVGTIYFDVVNASTTYAAAGNYKIKVEVSLDAGTNYTEYAMKPFKREDTTTFVADQTDTKELKLEITSGGTAGNFYRVAVPVNSSASVQFRIVRTARVPSNVWGDDENGFILLDNILVSYPKSTASLEPYGSFDRSRTGRQVLGWAGAMAEPFPTAGEKGVYARAKAIVNINESTHSAETNMPIAWAQMHYRWRYLSQSVDGWQEIGLRPTAGFTSIQPLVLPSGEGDIEFWYDYVVQVPAYKYHDYSGEDLDLNGTDGNPLYTEDVTASTNNQMAVTGYTTLASGGTDWFFRLRRGKSDWESFTIYAKESEDGEVKSYDMTLVGNHIWRGLIPSRTALEGGLYVRIAGRNRQTAGSEDYDLNMTRYSIAGNADALPATDTLSAKDDDESWAWFTVPCDARSGQILIQLQDDTLGYTVVHADYQDFNGWTDANKTDGKGLFIGTTNDTSSAHMAGTTAEAKTYDSHFDTWNETVATNKYWSEHFVTTNPAAWTLYAPFSAADSPNGFTVGPGQWVNGYYRDNTTGMALQMEGRGKGFIQLVDAVGSPRGLESVAFRARVAQSIEFGDFCYLMGDPTSMANYTFMTAASFDVNSRNDFAGSASLSLVALYTPGVGCFELRVEQENASVNPSSGAVSPGTKFRFSLYRWSYDDEQEDVVPTLLGSDCSGETTGTGYFATDAKSENYTRLYISVDNSVEGETRIIGGVAKNSVARSSFFNSATYREIAYRDTTPNRSTTGTYGLLSANCPAHFVQPSYVLTPVALWSMDKDTFNNKNYRNHSNFTPMTSTSRVPCQPDLAAGRWAIKKARMEKVNDASTTTYGINAVEPSTQVHVYTAPVGTTQWGKTPLFTTNIVGFGSSSSSGTPISIPIYSLESCSVKIAAGGTEKTARKDVTIDDIDFRQWCGENYDDKGQDGVFDPLDYGAYTNIVFTQGWINKGEDSAGNPRTTCLLSAKRSKYDAEKSTGATSIRSPRMVNEDDTGRGLGRVSFTYEDAQSNAVVLVQIATNNVALSSFDSLTKSTSTNGMWTTVTNIDFRVPPWSEKRKEGFVSVYLGLHGMRGAMRIALDPDTVTSVANITDPSRFGEVTITGVEFRDEPMLDKYSWWGWNLRTTNDPDMQSLADNANDPLKNGLALGLNNSVDLVEGELRTDEPLEQYKKKYPFVQTPTFATNMVNEVSFMARLYNTNDAAARVTLYGARSGDVSDESRWVPLHFWDVTNTVYTSCWKKFGAGNSYRAFRLAVTGVPGVTDPMPDHDPPYKPDMPARRVLIDEVLVMEGIVATVSFRNVGAFRTGLDEKTAALNVPSAEQQPLCGEEWGVQCEIYASQLADEISLSNATVRLWWYEGETWGFENWRDLPGAKRATLTPASDSNLVFRSGYFSRDPSSVIDARMTPATVQYMLSVEYKNTESDTWQTNWLTSADWPTPAWYRPLDYNADRGSFSAYTILDTVAPGWAWINEVNVFGRYDDNYGNSDRPLQFVEVAAPATADLYGWKLRFLEAQMGGSPVELRGVITNDVAFFGENLPSKKTKGMDPDSKMVFHVIGAPASDGVLSKEDGRRDGTWIVTQTAEMVQGGEVMSYYPISMQLVRPSGIIESEIVAIGTNEWSYVSSYNAEYAAELLSKQERGGNFINVGMDSGGVPPNADNWSASIGVFAGAGESYMQWGCTNLMSPGRLNNGQVITGQAPEPRGSAFLIYSILQGGDITQTFGEAVDTNETVMLIFRKGSPTGTNITYHTTKWHELGPVVVNGQTATPVPTGNPREWILNVGKATSNDIMVVASAQVDSSLASKYGVPETSRYRDAIVKWLMRGMRADGVTPFKNPDATELGLADFANRAGNVITNMTLTEMYWLDIDPTWNDGDIKLKADWVSVPMPKGNGDLTSRIYMQITNSAAGGAGWPPNVLQGVDFEKNSWVYADPSENWQWTSATFKIKGILPVPGLSLSIESNWVPQRWFVFVQNSFDADCTSEIEMYDPFSPTSPGFNAAWYNWRQTHPSESVVPFFKWDISDRGVPAEAEILRPANPCRP